MKKYADCYNPNCECIDCKRDRELLKVFEELTKKKIETVDK